MYIEELNKYNKKQISFIMAMIETDNIKKSAEIANISEPTAYNYLKKRNIRRNKQNTKGIY